MKVDLSKYKCFDYIEKSDTILNIRTITEPYVAKSPNYESFFYDQVYFIYHKYLDSAYRADKHKVITYKYYTRREKELIINLPDNLYINEGQFEIPYEYYSRAYIEFFDIEILEDKANLDLTPKIIIFGLDSVGRLHVKKECLANYIYCMEKKLPNIKCNIEVGRGVTSEAQYEIAEKYLAPRFIFPDKKELFEIFAKKDSIAYNYLKSINKDKLDFYLFNFIKRDEIDRGVSKKLTGYAFSDGSSLFFEGSTLYHYMLVKILLGIDADLDEWEEENTIKFDTLHYSRDMTLALYNPEILTPQMKNFLYKLKKNYNIEEQHYSTGKKKYYDTLTMDDTYKRRNVK